MQELELYDYTYIFRLESSDTIHIVLSNEYPIVLSRKMKLFPIQQKEEIVI